LSKNARVRQVARLKSELGEDSQILVTPEAFKNVLRLKLRTAGFCRPRRPQMTTITQVGKADFGIDY
jgi:hypothetical protein